MGLRGRAFLPMWWDLAEGSEAEFGRWHTIEHMPERLGIPGFLRGRRYIEAHGALHFFQCYEGAHIEVFRSPGYLARLDAPTDWSNRVQPSLLNLVRGACRTLVSVGEGVGGSLLALRCRCGHSDHEEAGQRFAAAALGIARLTGVTGVHLGLHQPEITRIETAETRLRPAATAPPFDFVLLVEGIGVAELDDATAPVLEAAKSARTAPGAAGVYRLAYLLDHEG